MIPEIPNPPQLAHIREEECIGCTKCLPACPVDAIAGGAKSLHVVISSFCIGCGLCVTPCPVDCIDMVEAPESADRAQAEKRHAAQAIRIQTLESIRRAQQKLRAISQKKREIAEAVARVQLKRQAATHDSQKN